MGSVVGSVVGGTVVGSVVGSVVGGIVVGSVVGVVVGTVVVSFTSSLLKNSTSKTSVSAFPALFLMPSIVTVYVLSYLLIPTGLKMIAFPVLPYN